MEELAIEPRFEFRTEVHVERITKLHLEDAADAAYLCGNQPVSPCTIILHMSFLGDDAAVTTKSRGERRAPPRHRTGVASMAWKSDFHTAVNLAARQVPQETEHRGFAGADAELAVRFLLISCDFG